MLQSRVLGRGSPHLGKRRSGFVLAGFCYVFLGLVVILALFGDAIAPFPPGQQNLATGITRPNPSALLGTDELGRDVLSRMIVGASTALYGPLLVALGQMIVGTLLGIYAAFRGGWADTLVMRWVELMSAVPSLLVCIVTIGVLGGGYWAAVLLLIILGSPGDTRLIRGAALDQVHRPYVEAAKTMGLSPVRIMGRHLCPNLWPIIVANTFLSFSAALVGLAALSFLGLGISPGTPDWGLMLAENRRILFMNPAALVAPALALALTSMSANVIGDDLFERLTARGEQR